MRLALLLSGITLALVVALAPRWTSLTATVGAAAARAGYAAGANEPDSEACADDDAMLTLQVGYAIGGGAPPPPDVAQTSLMPAAGLEVRVVPAGDGSAPAVATGVTGDDGMLALTLPAGSYWVFVPVPSNGGTGIASAAARTRMPDGMRVLGWTAVELGPGDSARVTIAIPILTPSVSAGPEEGRA